jgi:IS5 family transposase
MSENATDSNSIRVNGERWSAADPVSPWEAERERRVANLTGVTNYVERSVPGGAEFGRALCVSKSELRNALIGRVGGQVETVFAHLKRICGYRRVRYFTGQRNAVQFALLCIAYNLNKATLKT